MKVGTGYKEARTVSTSCMYGADSIGQFNNYEQSDWSVQYDPTKQQVQVYLTWDPVFVVVVVVGVLPRLRVNKRMCLLAV